MTWRGKMWRLLLRGEAMSRDDLRSSLADDGDTIRRMVSLADVIRRRMATPPPPPLPRQYDETRVVTSLADVTMTAHRPVPAGGRKV
ncbi:MAG: hypothetical protein N3E40_06435 [Dehalococcoidia bacterium]|nr:hypothetical protein [Dehalococcoidia bacterium]